MADNSAAIEKYNALFAKADQVLSQWEYHPAAIMLGDQSWIDLMNSIWNTVYSSAISSFVSTIEASFSDDDDEDDDYQKIIYLLDKWDGISEDVRADQQAYEDFKIDLIDFSENFPDWFSGRQTMLFFFEECIWKPYIKPQHDKAVIVANRIQNILNRKYDKYHILIESNYALVNPFEFEKVIADLFVRMGYETQVTKKTGDFGVDIIAIRGDERLAIQVKKYAKANNIGNRDVQRLLGAMQLRTIKATKAILITTSDFTAQAREQAIGTPMELWNGEYLNKMMRKYYIFGNPSN